MKKIYYTPDLEKKCPYKNVRIGSPTCRLICKYKVKYVERELLYVCCNHPSFETNRNKANKG